MPKRRITKASKLRLSVFGTFSLIAIIYFCVSLGLNLYKIYDLTQEKNKLENLYIELQEKAEELKLDIEKLKDPDYLADYARENYLYSKDDEYILQIEEIVETTEKIDIMSKEINKNYVILGLIFIIFSIFMYIVIKANKKNQKK